MTASDFAGVPYGDTLGIGDYDAVGVLAGYQQTDDPRKPIKSYRIRRRLIDLAEKYAPHRISIRAEFGELSLRLDGVDQFFDPEPSGSGAGSAVSSGSSHTAVLSPAGKGDVLTCCANTTQTYRRNQSRLAFVFGRQEHGRAHDH